ncbi:MAG: AmmeMemoRadiSam system radical SAM enzyme [Acidobacteriota bacterium]
MIREAMLYKTLDEDRVNCFLCAHRCEINPGNWGICRVRENKEGKLYTHVFGEVIAAHVDPIEKKPLYHFLPGTKAFSIATIGCNFQCPFCQNWQISQASRQKEKVFSGYKLSPEEVVRQALTNDCSSISYTYTEPTIFFEYAYETAKLAKKEGLGNNFVTNGYLTQEAVEKISPWLDAANVDLKSFRDEFYKKMCKARLQPVLDCISFLKKNDIWVEVTTLIIPGENDSDKELREIARFLAGVDPNIPWHISRFHPDYKFTDSRPTPMERLRRAVEIGKEEGLNYLYVGNVWGESGDIVCPSCGKTLVQRNGFYAARSVIKQGQCPDCGHKIDGIF